MVCRWPAPRQGHPRGTAAVGDPGWGGDTPEELQPMGDPHWREKQRAVEENQSAAKSGSKKWTSTELLTESYTGPQAPTPPRRGEGLKMAAKVRGAETRAQGGEVLDRSWAWARGRKGSTGCFFPFLSCWISDQKFVLIGNKLCKNSVTPWCFTHSSVHFQLKSKLKKKKGHLVISYLRFLKYLHSISAVLLRQNHYFGF